MSLALVWLIGCETKDRCLEDGASRGGWVVQFGGGGCVEVASGGTLHLAPAAIADSSETRASLVVGSSHGATFGLRARMITDGQLRTGTPPNPWEVAWLVWDYTDDEHFYYAVLKPTGWEVGKRDPAYPGGQRFLATGESPVYPIGQWYGLEVVRVEGRTSLTVDSVPITVFTDPERPYQQGRVALYTEDAAARFEDIDVTNAPLEW